MEDITIVRYPQQSGVIALPKDIDNIRFRRPKSPFYNWSGYNQCWDLMDKPKDGTVYPEYGYLGKELHNGSLAETLALLDPKHCTYLMFIQMPFEDMCGALCASDKPLVCWEGDDTTGVIRHLTTEKFIEVLL